MTASTKTEDCFSCDYRENRKYILDTLGRIESKLDRSEERAIEAVERMQALIDRIDDRVHKNTTEISKLGVRAGILSTLAGFVALIGLVIWEWVRGSSK